MGASHRPALRAVAAATSAALAALLLLAVLTSVTGPGLFTLPFAASAAVVALAPTAPFAQPRSIVVGHLVAAALAVGVTAVTGPSIWAAAGTAGLVTAPMLLLRAPHPPAVATAALIGLTAPGPLFLVYPVLVGSAVVVGCGVLVGTLLPTQRYPVTWR